MRTFLLLFTCVFVILLGTRSTFGADVIPPEAGPVPPASPAPHEPPGSQPQLSPRDPGMVVQPETVPSPGSVVEPPVVDPKMAINPEAPQPNGEPAEKAKPTEPPQRGTDR